MDENMLLASGAGSTRGICATAAYFESLTTPESLDFGWRYTQRFGSDAPILNSLGESCHEGVLMLAALGRQAQSLDTTAMCAVADSVSYEGLAGSSVCETATSTSVSTSLRRTTSSSTSSPSSSDLAPQQPAAQVGSRRRWSLPFGSSRR